MPRLGRAPAKRGVGSAAAHGWHVAAYLPGGSTRFTTLLISKGRSCNTVWLSVCVNVRTHVPARVCVCVLVPTAPYMRWNKVSRSQCQGWELPRLAAPCRARPAGLMKFDPIHLRSALHARGPWRSTTRRPRRAASRHAGGRQRRLRRTRRRGGERASAMARRETVWVADSLGSFFFWCTVRGRRRRPPHQFLMKHVPARVILLVGRVEEGIPAQPVEAAGITPRPRRGRPADANLSLLPRFCLLIVALLFRVRTAGPRPRAGPGCWRQESRAE